LSQRRLHESDSWPEALYNIGSGSWMASAANHTATIYCP